MIEINADKTSNKIPKDVLETYVRIENKNIYVNL
ncbi:hypothetical protein [Salmonella phage SD-2_S15]|nr:hypothetical protein [Salmonella phage SD-2_S15]